MSVSQAGAASNSIAPYALNWRGLSGYQHNSSADQAVSSVNAASKRQALSSNFGDDSAQVTLSDAARALAALTSNGADASGSTGSASSATATSATGASGGTDATGSSDFNQEAQYLGSVADASLVAMGIISPDQQSGTQITFNSLSYNVSSSASAGVSQQNGQSVAEYGSDQQAEFVGQGQITTADGRTFDFQIEVDLDQSQQVEGASGADGVDGTQSAGNSTALAADSTPSALPATSDDSSTDPTSSTASSGGLINWNEILKQSQSLFDLLDSIGKENQTNSATAASSSNSATAAAGSTAANAASGVAGASSAGASQGSTASSSDSQSSSQNPSQNQAASLA